MMFETSSSRPAVAATVNLRVGNAPCSWGVEFAQDPRNPPWQQCLDEARGAGYSAIDLGPYGYLPTETAALTNALASRGLSLTAGGLFDPLHDAASLPDIVAKTRSICRLISAVGCQRLVIIDDISPEQAGTVGQAARARRLEAADWKTMMVNIAEIARVAQEFGVASSLHAHAGCYIEFEDELDRAMDDLPADLVGLCVDTGHALYAGYDPAAVIRRYGSRLRHLHLKDVDVAVRDRVVADAIDFYAAAGMGVFCPLGQGDVDFDGVRAALAEIGYSGWATVEQDVDPRLTSSFEENARTSLTYLRQVGIASGR